MITKEEVQRIATLAKLSFTEEELEKLTVDFSNILGYMEEINKLDLSGVEPMTHISDTVNVFREDVVVPSVSTEDALRNAPKRNDSFFKVPKVLGQSEEG